MKGWIEDVLRVGTLFKRLDLGEGTYVRELESDIVSSAFLASVFENLQTNEIACREFQKQYEKYDFLWTTDLSKMFAEFIQDATSEDGKMDLTKFDAEMLRLASIKEQVGALKTPTNIGWLKIDSTPIKENIIYWVQKWLFLYIGYLRDDVVSKLQELRTFMITTKKGLQRQVSSGDTKTLMSVMGNIRDVRKRMEATAQMLDPLKATVLLLKAHKVDIEDEVLYGTQSGGNSDDAVDEPILEFLDSAGLKWDSLVNFTFRVKEEIMPLQNQEIESINKNLSHFKAGVEDFRRLFKDEQRGAPMSFSGSIDEAYAHIDRFQVLYEEKVARAKELNSLEELFELPVSKYRTLSQTGEELRILKCLWDFRALQTHTYMSWNCISWKTIDTIELQDANRLLMKELEALGNQQKIIKTWGLYTEIAQDCKDMAIILPLVTELHSPAMRARHWKAIALACRVSTIHWESERFCFESILELHLEKRAQEVSEQVETAEKELRIEKKLEIIESRWETFKLDWVDSNGVEVSRGEEDNQVLLPRPSDEVVENLESDQMELQSMVGMGKFVKYFKERVTKWLNTLSDVEENLKDWLNVSKQWGSLESIFLSSEDIRTQLPDDTKRFEGIDSEFRLLQQGAVGSNPLVVEQCTSDGLRETLKKMLADLAKCQKSLTEYLDTKKKVFPRFYFVSNAALLDILSNSNSPRKVVQYLADCYTAISDLTFEDTAPEEPCVAVAMSSDNGETVHFPTPFLIQGSVEQWLDELTGVQINAIKTILRHAIDTAVNWEHEKARHDWLFDYPAQVALEATHIYWSEETETSLEDYQQGNDEAVKLNLDKVTERLNKLIETVEKEMSKGERLKLISLITMDVHSRDVVQKLIDEKAEGPSSFLWQRQLRKYWKTLNPNMEVDIKICDFQAKYSYEYVGNSSRLVVTPLTDRCYITLTTAMRLMLGGAPAGPAGTGKTETTKDLAKALAVPCYVFNCSDQMNYQTLGDIFKGLSQVGGWGCFDEFNRIPIEVLSVVATQMKTVLDAIVFYSEPSNRPIEMRAEAGDLGEIPGNPPCKVGTFDFFGDTLTLIPTTGFFITMNPGYAGRTELPENLKALFRSCAMIRPDIALICENMLMAEGFQKARVLSVKFVTLYELASQLLSSQSHYDWGLRAVKSVLTVAGKLKRENPETDEEPILMRALRDYNTPKIPQRDMAIFLRLIRNLFPKYSEKTPPVIHQHLRQVAQAVCTSSGLQADEGFVTKLVQLNELLSIRHSVMLIGCSGCGKTAIWKTLKGCLNELGRQQGCEKNVAVSETVFPKAVSSDELYGFMTLSKDWKDGILSMIMRGMSKDDRDLGYYAHQTSKWVVLDGDIDAVWIESMNTVMDDNKVLTLVSNERIPLSESMRMVFEINSLANATPATVSRAGILYVNESDIGWQAFVDSWILTLSNDSAKSRLPGFFDSYVDKIIQGCKQYGIKEEIMQYNLAKVKTLCALLNSQLDAWVRAGEDVELLEHIFAFCCIWAFGGALMDERTVSNRSLFNEMFLHLFPGVVRLEEGTTVFDYYVDPEKVAEERWVAWANDVEEIAPLESSQHGLDHLYVRTATTLCLSTLMQKLVLQGQPMMVIGAVGTGKTTIIRNTLREFKANDENLLFNYVSMHYFMDSKALQSQVEAALDKRSGRVFGPAGNKSMVLFVDDLNLPFQEQYGTQTAIALLRQLMTCGSVFDRSDVGFRKEIVDLKYVGAMNPKAGSLNISERAQILFSTLACPMPDDNQLYTIYSSMLESFNEACHERLGEILDSLASATIALYKKVTEKFLASATKVVYSWNMRELTSVFRGITCASAATLKSPLETYRLWVHECYRTFGDRMVEETDVTRFRDLIKDVSKTFSIEEFNKMHEEPLIFAQLGPGCTYSMVHSEELLQKELYVKLQEYNDTFPVMDLVLFYDAIKHITRITRILNTPGGNALLIGVGGSGKQSLSKLATFICGYELRQIPVSSEFDLGCLLSELQVYVKTAGIRGIPVTWLVSESQIFREEVLVYVNDLVANGWIPELFPKDELSQVLDGLKGELRALGMSDTLQDKIDLFVSRVRKNLHVVLSLSPVGEAFRTRIRRFPALVHGSVIDWFHPWPEDALVSVATHFLSGMTFPDQDILENVAYHMSFVHQQVMASSEKQQSSKEKRFNYVTPKSFLEFLSFYEDLFVKQQSNTHSLIQRLQNGLGVLTKTAVKVEDLKDDLKMTLANVEEKKAASEVLMEQIGTQRAEAEKQKEAAAVEKAKAEAATQRARELQESADKELLAATPAMEAASEAILSLKKSPIIELKSMSKPPQGVELVTKACLMMIENENRNFKWERAKKMMANVEKFLEALKSYDADNMEPKLIEKLEPIIQNPLFTHSNMEKKSSAAANLCDWVCNIYKYNRIYVKVRPLVERLEQANQDKAMAEEELLLVEQLAADVEKRLEELKQTYVKATEEKMAVEELAKECVEKLDLANRLVTGLATENARWVQEVDKLRASEVNLIGSCAVSAAFVGYIGGFDAGQREQLWKGHWVRDLVEREIPIESAESIDPLSLLMNETRKAEMMDEGLPADRVSVENGTIIVNCTRWPLIIDPQQQGIKWLTNRFTCVPSLQKEDSVKSILSANSRASYVSKKKGPVFPRVIQLSKQGWREEVCEAIEQGEVLFIENLGEVIDTELEPVLSRQVIKKGRNKFIRFAGKEIGYDDAFRLFLFTKLPNPHYSPELQAQCTLVNFIATEKGLEDQILVQVVQSERPDKEEEQQRLLRDFNKYKIQLTILEDDLLHKLANAPQDILSDVHLIEGLEATKAEVEKIDQAVVDGKKVLKEISKIRDTYRVVASEASMLYFMLTKLSAVNHMYQYSLEAFMQFFFKAIQQTKVAEKETERRVDALRSCLRLTIFTWVSRGLFEEHKLTFLSHLTLNLMRRQQISAADWDEAAYEFLLRRPVHEGRMQENELVEWLPDDCWNAVLSLARLDVFSNLPNDLLEAPQRFKEWFNSAAPEREKLPLDWAQLDRAPFLKLLVIRCLRPDRMRAAMEDFVRLSLPDGKAYVDCGSTLNSYSMLEEAFENSSSSVPIYFVLSPGLDIVADVDSLAVANGLEKGRSYHNISMGQGQDKVAQDLIELANQQGHWVILNNVHLMPSWLSSLEILLDRFKASGSHNNFRLFLSSDPSSDIPIGILARCIKLTNEPPTGLKANLKRAFCSFPKAFIEEADSRTKAVLFGLCQFHSVMMERKKFGPMGFNKMYPFSLGDLRDSAVCLNNYMEISSGSGLPWADLKYIFGEIIYGGHIVDDFDRLLANTYLDYFMNDELLDELELYPYAEGK